MSTMFCNCMRPKEIDVSGFDTSNVTDMSTMFFNCQSARSIDTSNFDVSNITDTSDMFGNCKNIVHASMAGWDAPNLTTTDGMFYRCKMLTDLDTSGLSTGNVRNTQDMFGLCESIKTLDLSGLAGTTESVTDMFRECTRLTDLDLSNLKVDPQYMSYGTFRDCKELLKLKVTPSMQRELEYQKVNESTTLTLSVTRVRPVNKDSSCVSVELLKDGRLRQYDVYALTRNITQHGDGVVSVMTGPFPTMETTDDHGRKVSAYMPPREIQRKHDIARKMKLRTPIHEVIEQPTNCES